MSAMGSAVVSMSRRAVWGPPGAGEGEGARAQLGEELALDLPLAVAEAPGETRHAVLGPRRRRRSAASRGR